jgi:retron-type reverse transcriptase
VDGETWRHYGEALEEHLRDRAARVKRGAYRASPVRRADIEKTDGRQRPLGVPTLEDKIVQRAVVAVLNAIYEQDFLGFSYGFRSPRSPHRALDALTVGIETTKVNWVLDADIQGFFGAPGEAGRFQRVQFPPRQGERAAPPGIEPGAHGGNDMG